MYRPFFITAILSILCTISVFIGRIYFPKFADDNLFVIIGFSYLFSSLIIFVLSLRDSKIIYTKKVILINLVLVLISTPAPLILAVMVKMNFKVELSEQLILPVNKHTIRKNIYKYRSGQISKIEYHKFDSIDWVGHYNEFYRDSIWTYFNRFGDTSKIEIYNHGKLIQTEEK